jgi:transglutaminase-like putative cysteine protease
MANLVRLTHSTYYRYDRPVSMGPHLIRLRPTPQSRTWVPSYALRVEPEPHFLNWIQDPYGNHMARVLFPELVDHFTIHVELTADLTVYNPFDFFLEPEAENWPFSMPPDLARDLAPYVLQASDPPGPLLADFMTRLPPTPAQTVPFLVSVNAMVQQAIGYNIRMEPTIQSPEETSRSAAVRAGTRRCSSSRCCGDSALLPVSYRAISSSSYPTCGPSVVRWVPTATSPICTRGLRCTYRVPGGSDSMPRRDCLPEKDTSRSPPRHAPRRPLPSKEYWTRVRCRLIT